MKRPGNNPKRQIAPPDLLTQDQRAALAQGVQYVASGHHKRHPADYGLNRTSPRPTKSLCDLIKVVPLNQAKSLLMKGILCGMFSSFCYDGRHPKFVWCVAE